MRNIDVFYLLAYTLPMKNTRYISTGSRTTGKYYIYRVSIERDGNRYYAEIPAIPWCYSLGATYEKALKNLKEALELCLETMIEDGEPIPEENPDTIRKAPITLGVIG